jgi:hypothetical protein
MQAFAYRHLVPAADLTVSARRAIMRAPPRILGEQPVKMPAGGTVRLRVQVQLPPAANLENLRFELSEPPEGIELREATPVQGGTELVLQCNAAKIKPGLKGNLIVNISAERPLPPAQAQARPQAAAARQRVPLGVLPAIPFQVVNQ